MRCWRARGWWWGVGLALVCLVGRMGAQGLLVAELPQTPMPGSGSVHGSLVDPDGASVGGAKVRLTLQAGAGQSGPGQSFETASRPDGTFGFDGVPAGVFVVKATPLGGLAPGEASGVVLPGKVVELPAMVLAVAEEDSEVTALSAHDAAEIEVKAEETQRILGILPNFGVTYNWHAPPLDAKQKFELATRQVVSPFTFGVTAVIVGIERATGDYSEFGRGASGYFRLYGTTTLDIAIGNELGGAVFPVLFKQDPRYFWKGTGSVTSRIGYAISRTLICRGDNGHNQFAVASLLGNFGAGALTNVYYPQVDRDGVRITLVNGLLAIAGDAAGNLEQEFLFKWFTPGARRKVANP